MSVVEGAEGVAEDEAGGDNGGEATGGICGDSVGRVDEGKTDIGVYGKVKKDRDSTEEAKGEAGHG